MTSSNPLRLVLSLVLFLLPFTLAQNTTSTAPSSSTTTITSVVQIFFINERVQEEGHPYTYTPKVSGSVLAVDTVSNLTTFVITSTRSERTRRPFYTSSSDLDSDSDTITDAPTTTITPAPYTGLSRTHHLGGGGGSGGPHRGKFNLTGHPTTITQGPNTFQFTGTRYGPDHSIINRCALNGTAQASCNMTYLGTAWYTRDALWNGTFSTYSYNWTLGDRFGYAPVTITAGAELLVGEGPGRPTPSSSSSSTTNKNCGGLMMILWVGLGVVGLGVML
ncbi:hypothetical protein QBC43DRAFT_354991 [Cladorrhinum sp. PSN259]|nr:hypothetical protein QBC43DRAFT_354991 [Cladorrhinum sp. PSN259]